MVELEVRLTRRIGARDRRGSGVKSLSSGYRLYQITRLQALSLKSAGLHGDEGCDEGSPKIRCC
jgi:hypothetical protein